MAEKQKKGFDWKPGSKLEAKEYEALGEVRVTGFSKLADGVFADPIKRKEARKVVLTKKIKKTKEEEGFFTEETTSGLSEEFTETEARRLISKDKMKIKGMNRFQK